MIVRKPSRHNNLVIRRMVGIMNMKSGMISTVMNIGWTCVAGKLPVQPRRTSFGIILLILSYELD